MIAPIELRLDDHGIPFADERWPIARGWFRSGFRQPERVNDGFAEGRPTSRTTSRTQGSCRRLVFSGMRPVESSKALSNQLRGRRIEFIESCRP